MSPQPAAHLHGGQSGLGSLSPLPGRFPGYDLNGDVMEMSLSHFGGMTSAQLAGVVHAERDGTVISTRRVDGGVEFGVKEPRKADFLGVVRGDSMEVPIESAKTAANGLCVAMAALSGEPDDEDEASNLDWDRIGAYYRATIPAEVAKIEATGHRCFPIDDVDPVPFEMFIVDGSDFMNCPVKPTQYISRWALNDLEIQLTRHWTEKHFDYLCEATAPGAIRVRYQDQDGVEREYFKRHDGTYRSGLYVDEFTFRVTSGKLTRLSGSIKHFGCEFSQDFVTVRAGADLELAQQVADALKVIADTGLDDAKLAALRAYGSRCSHCNRPLKDEVSKVLGVGPDCAKTQRIPHTLEFARRVQVLRKG